MRDRPFLQAGESPRPYSELLAERRGNDPRSRILDEIARLESAAAGAETETERKALQCEAEDLRCALSRR